MNQTRPDDRTLEDLFQKTIVNYLLNVKEKKQPLNSRQRWTYHRIN